MYRIDVKKLWNSSGRKAASEKKRIKNIDKQKSYDENSIVRIQSERSIQTSRVC